MKNLFFIFFPSLLFSAEVFKVIVLGSGGGPLEGDLSSYLIAPKDSSNFIAIDAGTLLEGIYKANDQGAFEDVVVDPKSPWNVEGQILRNHVKGYFISHAHLDHVAGLVFNSIVDTNKPIYGLDSTIDYLKEDLFNGHVWPNFGNEGKRALNQYQYIRLHPNEIVDFQDLQVETFLLNHPGCYLSTAFLIRYQDDYILYFGDTSPDALETEKRIETVWKRLAPIIQEDKLHAIFLECSFTNKTADHELFGHLNPKFIMKELRALANRVDPKNPSSALKGLKVLITHIKNPPLKGVSPSEVIQKELEEANDLGVEFLFVRQAEKILL